MDDVYDLKRIKQAAMDQTIAAERYDPGLYVSGPDYSFGRSEMINLIEQYQLIVWEIDVLHK